MGVRTEYIEWQCLNCSCCYLSNIGLSSNACIDFNVRKSRDEELHEEKNVGGCILAHSMGEILGFDKSCFLL